MSSKKKSAYVSPDAKCYREGGYTLIKDQKRSIFIAIDHADLGYGTLAAHGHADALSFQMYVKGEPIFVDPGSPNYHITPQERDNYRSTYWHNTASVEHQNQSEMLGAFLWGKRATTKVVKFSQKDGTILIAETFYNSIRHYRRFKYKNGVLILTDIFLKTGDKEKQQISSKSSGKNKKIHDTKFRLKEKK